MDVKGYQFPYVMEEEGHGERAKEEQSRNSVHC